MELVICLVVAIVIAVILQLLFRAPSWCTDCMQASHDEWEAGQMGYNGASYSRFCLRHGKMWLRGLDPQPRADR